MGNSRVVIQQLATSRWDKPLVARVAIVVWVAGAVACGGAAVQSRTGAKAVVAPVIIVSDRAIITGTIARIIGLIPLGWCPRGEHPCIIIGVHAVISDSSSSGSCWRSPVRLKRCRRRRRRRRRRCRDAVVGEHETPARRNGDVGGARRVHLVDERGGVAEHLAGDVGRHVRVVSDVNERDGE